MESFNSNGYNFNIQFCLQYDQMVIKLILQGMRSIITMVMNKYAVNVSSVDKIWHMIMKYSM